MELQNQIYVIISVFAGLAILLLILIVLLSIYVKKSIEMISTKTANENYSNNDLVAMNKLAVKSMNSATRGSFNLGYASEIHKSEDGYKGNFGKNRNYDKSEACHTYDNRGYRKETAFGKQLTEKRNDISHHGSTYHPDTTIAGRHFSMVFDGSNIFHMDGNGKASDYLESANDGHNVRCAENRRTKSTVESETISTNNSRIRGRSISGNNTNCRSNHPHANKNIKHKDVVDAFDEGDPSYYARDTHDANMSFYERAISY